MTAALAALVESRVGAVAAKDIETLVAQYAEDVTLFDALGPLRDTGQDVERNRLREWFGAYRSTIDLRIKDLEVVADGDAGFAHYLFQVRGTMTDGTEVDMWVRSTVGFRRGDDGWKIVHEHSSVPFTPSGTAGG
ncbi:nuclear transport factor 2 family protein [Amycolatopsis mongoliensis]|uniref:Nuclear transport factor 2 family protein n=1 Tax=Amycolatopsis mongoliensis TaxID=715475 RepID=A0A9Y2JM49_9PSEU|nr:nuclear transport factor 2 family protein [Amycolatopsis sp. 4-36]WIX99801.1 nuclear transport factor 2 family protein [Amycolatopsis sp. 4-36]